MHPVASCKTTPSASFRSFKSFIDPVKALSKVCVEATDSNVENVILLLSAPCKFIINVAPEETVMFPE